MLREAGLDAPARDRLITALFRHLGLMTFYTAGEPEAHAWSAAARRDGARSRRTYP